MSLTSDILHKLRRAYRNKQGTHFTADELRHLASLGVLHLVVEAEADEIVADLGIVPPKQIETATDDLPPVFSVRTLAHRWRCSEGLIRKLISKGEIQHFRHGNLVRIPVEAALSYEQVGVGANGSEDAGAAARQTAAWLKRMPRK